MAEVSSPRPHLTKNPISLVHFVSVLVRRWPSLHRLQYFHRHEHRRRTSIGYGAFRASRDSALLIAVGFEFVTVSTILPTRLPTGDYTPPCRRS